jgi:hypothetical protein
MIATTKKRSVTSVLHLCYIFVTLSTAFGECPLTAFGECPLLLSEIDQDETRMIESLFDEASQEEMEHLYMEDLEAFYEYPTDEELEAMYIEHYSFLDKEE